VTGLVSLRCSPCCSINVTVNAVNPVPSLGLIILFGRDWLYFDQLMWPITTSTPVQYVDASRNVERVM